MRLPVALLRISDGELRTPLPMRNATEPLQPQLYYLHAGHCTGCEVSFPADAVRYMVSEQRVVWRLSHYRDGSANPRSMPRRSARYAKGALAVNPEQTCTNGSAVAVVPPCASGPRQNDTWAP